MNSSEKEENSIKREARKMDSLGSCIFVAGYSIVLILVVFITELLQGNNSKMEAVSAMSNKTNQISGTWEELERTKLGEENWWSVNIQTSLEYILRETVQKYIEDKDSGMQEEGDPVNEGVAAEQQAEGLADTETGVRKLPVGEVIPHDTIGQESADMQQEEVVQEPEAEQDEDREKKNRKKRNRGNKKNKSNKSNKKESAISLSMEEKRVLLRIVEAEATDENIKGKMLVANVVLNRVNNKKFPNTVKKVVFQNDGNVYQFSPIADGRYWDVSITKETKVAVGRVLNGEDHSEGALYFLARKYARAKNVRWFDNNLDWLFKYGVHEFYK